MVLCLARVIGVAISLVLDELPPETVLASGAFNAAISVANPGAQATEDLAVLGSPFPDSMRRRTDVSGSQRRKVLFDPI